MSEPSFKEMLRMASSEGMTTEGLTGDRRACLVAAMTKAYNAGRRIELDACLLEARDTVDEPPGGYGWIEEVAWAHACDAIANKLERRKEDIE